MASQPIMTSTHYRNLVLADGTILGDRHKFQSDGSIGFAPRFVNLQTGQFVFLHAVIAALPVPKEQS